MKHHEKFNILNECFTGAKHLLPVLNRENNEALIISIDPGRGEHYFQRFSEIQRWREAR